MALTELVIVIFAIFAIVTIIVGFRAMKSAVPHSDLIEGE
jgi:hypothetical protein